MFHKEYFLNCFPLSPHYHCLSVNYILWPLVPENCRLNTENKNSDMLLVGGSLSLWFSLKFIDHLSHYLLNWKLKSYNYFLWFIFKKRRDRTITAVNIESYRLDFSLFSFQISFISFSQINWLSCQGDWCRYNFTGLYWYFTYVDLRLERNQEGNQVHQPANTCKEINLSTGVLGNIPFHLLMEKVERIKEGFSLSSADICWCFCLFITFFH